MSLLEIFDKIVPVLLAGLFFGAGLPALYAVGMRFLSGRTEHTADGQLVEIQAANPVAKALGYLIFVFIAGMIVLGILWIAKDFIYFMTGISILGAK